MRRWPVNGTFGVDLDDDPISHTQELSNYQLWVSTTTQQPAFDLTMDGKTLVE